MEKVYQIVLLDIVIFCGGEMQPPMIGGLLEYARVGLSVACMPGALYVRLSGRVRLENLP